MRARDWMRLLALIERLTARERQDVLGRLERQAVRDESLAVLEQVPIGACPVCGSAAVVRNGLAGGLQRYKCKDCSKRFNALTGTPLARLRNRELWMKQAQAMDDGLSITKAAEAMQVARSTAFRWRHRFLVVANKAKPAQLCGIAEMDETFVLESFKGREVVGRPPRKRGSVAGKRGLSAEQIPILVVRDRSGSTTDFVLSDTTGAGYRTVLTPVLSPDTVVCSDKGGSIGAAIRGLGLEHHTVSPSTGRVSGPWHIQNVNAYHSRFKGWMHRFRGVATAYLENYLGWFRALERTKAETRRPACLLRLATGH